MDNDKVRKRKYNRGRKVEGQWVFGDIQEYVPTKHFVDRTSATLLEVIRQHIHPGLAVFLQGDSYSLGRIQSHGRMQSLSGGRDRRNKFGKLKSNRGRKVEGQFVFGDFQKNDPTNLFVQRTSATLLKVIRTLPSRIGSHSAGR